jgi:hypothetical protein
MIFWFILQKFLSPIPKKGSGMDIAIPNGHPPLKKLNLDSQPMLNGIRHIQDLSCFRKGITMNMSNLFMADYDVPRICFFSGSSENIAEEYEVRIVIYTFLFIVNPITTATSYILLNFRKQSDDTTK